MGKRCLVALCTNWPFIPTETAQSLMELGWGDRVSRAKEAHGFAEIAHVWVKKMPRVDALRDVAAMMALDAGFSHLLFLDADHVWPTDVLVRLLAHHDRDIVGGLYVQRGAPYAPVALIDGVKPNGSGVTWYQHDHAALGETSLRPLQVIGMGCTLIHTEVFRHIGPRPWFEYQDTDEGWPMISEDVPFCEKARRAGFTVWLDPTIVCGHVGSVVTDPRWTKRHQESAQRTIDKLQEAMTVSIVEAPAHG